MIGAFLFKNVFAQMQQIIDPGDGGGGGPTYYTLSVYKTGTGTGSVSGDGSYLSGEIATAYATPNSNSTFSGWTGGCNSYGDVTMTYNRSCTANFTLIPPKPIVTVTAEPNIVGYGGISNIGWTSTGAAYCTPPVGYESAGTGITGNFTTTNLYNNTTFTVSCSTPGSCSGSYSQNVSWDGTSCSGCTIEGVLWQDSGWCGNCSDAGNIAYEIINGSWYSRTCSKNTILGVCFSSHWSNGTAYIRPIYETRSCSSLTQTPLRQNPTCSSISTCTWHP